MTEEDEGFDTQPKDEHPGKGRGPPKTPPGFKGRPASDMPENVPDYVGEVVESKPDEDDENAVQAATQGDKESKGEGRLGMQVIDDDGKVKQFVEYNRVPGEGSIELRARKSEVQDGIKWLKTRRDKVPGQGDK